ncbi:hypothetical protein [Companilactobacillus allii]|nr:hypothetical protein [Companilactobacillus allii]
MPLNIEAKHTEKTVPHKHLVFCNAYDNMNLIGYRGEKIEKNNL